MLLCAVVTRASFHTNRCAAACTGCQKIERDRVADLFRIPDVIGLDAADGGKRDRANTADANGGKSPRFGGGKRKGYFIDQAGTKPCRTGRCLGFAVRQIRFHAGVLSYLF